MPSVQCFCQNCGAEFWRSPSQAKKYCSVKCRAEKQVKPELWKKIRAVWIHMIARCYKPKSSNYHRYGVKGIGVCDEWRKSFETFYEWSIANGYSPDLELDRRKTRGNYEPGNCRWATHSQNMQNCLKKSTGRSSFKGVHWDRKSKKWRAEVRHNGIRRGLGMFPTEVQAAFAYDDAAYEIAGEYAHINFPERKQRAA